jgi:NADH dehydrogenase [ubiquinone] 1 alpha subcomplex assembly factor 5
MSLVANLFCTKQVALKKQRIFKQGEQKPIFLVEMENRLLEILFDEVKISPQNILQTGFTSGHLAKYFKASKITYLDSIENEIFPKFENKFDLIVSLNLLHNINDVVGFLIQSRNILSEKGLFVVSFLGENSLNELKNLFIITEDKLFKTASPRFHPQIDVKNMGVLMQRAGFKMPLSFGEKFIVSYQNYSTLIKDLRVGFLTSTLIQKNKKYLGKNFYNSIKSSINENGIQLTFEVITAIGWKS